jgi:lipopolysaccharide/colanic/teichoic acid biosynthesis glycosyltransferase
MIYKRIFDTAVSLILVVVTSPVWVGATIAIWLESGFPILYKHDRVGKSGDKFKMYKFRSMIEDADQMGPQVTSENDRRITRVGSYLRAWKIDELPNLINVLKGDMSLVGPRAESPEYIDYISDYKEEILSVKPGITDPCMAGEYRNEEKILSEVSDPEEYYIEEILPVYARENASYVRRQPSIWVDVKILARTFISVVFK